MRRLALVCVPLVALLAPAAALALKNAVVTLVVDGTALGHISTGSPDQLDKVVIQDFSTGGGDIGASITNNAPTLTRTTLADNKTSFVGSDFRWRAAGGTYRIWIYGTGVNVFAVGRGTVTLQGLDASSSDGKYSLDGGDWRSLPGVPSDLLHFGSTG